MHLLIVTPLRYWAGQDIFYYLNTPLFFTSKIYCISECFSNVRCCCEYIFLSYMQTAMGARWESNINVLFGISILMSCVRELSAQPQERREGQGTAAKQWLRQFPALPSAPAVEPRVHINEQHTNSDLENYGAYMETINPCRQFYFSFESEGDSK